MDSILRGLVVYAVLLVLFRITGKRTLAQITTFDAVLLLIISEAVQPALVDNDNSMTNAFLIILALLGTDALLSFVTMRSSRIDKLINDVPMILIEDGEAYQDRMAKVMVTEDDIMESARQLRGVERLDQIKYAFIERSGTITVIPRHVGWVNPGTGPGGGQETEADHHQPGRRTA